jgi:leucyl aminopeptidase (aminopeptidase T)
MLMRGPRLEILADNLLDHSLEVRPGERVCITGESGALDLRAALLEGA